MAVATEPLRRTYVTAGGARPVLVWELPAETVCISSSALGGGLGERAWVINAQVDLDYHHERPAEHLAEIASSLGLEPGCGVGLLTAAETDDMASAADGGVECAATVGVTMPTWAAGWDGTWSRWAPGTINAVCWVPAPLSPAALVNAVVTATEAKSQVLIEAGVPGTGTASDAVVVCCPAGGGEPYGGPRSYWGSRLARAVHAAVAKGLGAFIAGHG